MDPNGDGPPGGSVPLRSRAPIYIALVVIVASIIAAALSLVTFFVPGAYLAVAVALLAYGWLVLIRHRRGRVSPPPGMVVTTHAAGPTAGDASPVTDEVPAGPTPESRRAERAVAAGLGTAAGFGLALVIVAVALAAILMKWRLVGIAALAVFAFMVLVSSPAWLAAAEDEMEAKEQEPPPGQEGDAR